MNKRLLVSQMAAETKLTRAEVTRALESFLRLVQASLARGERVTLAGFGSFAISQHKSRLVRDPRTGESLRIKARAVPRFAAGLELKMALEHGKEDHPCYTRPS